MFEIFELGLCNKFFPGSTLHVIVGFFAVFLIGYLLGSLDFGVIISSAIYKDDIRRHGSGGAGATNMLRTYGKLPAAATFLGDGLKTAAAVVVGALFLGSHSAAIYDKGGVVYAGYAGMYIGGAAAVVGHAFPIYYKFKGGKGVVATFVMVLLTQPLAALLCLLFFVAIVAATKYISLGSIMSVIVYPLVLYKMTGAGMQDLIAIFIMLFVVFLHRGNIKRLLNGAENKLDLKLGKKRIKDEDGKD